MHRSTVVLLIGIALGVILRVQALPLKTTVTHDEGITFLAATAHQGEFTELYDNHLAPYGRWVDAAEWKAFLANDRFWCFRKIASDIARYDIHPPLYFWLVHVWVWFVGVHAWSGAALGVIITLVTALVLYGFARYVLDDRLYAAVVVLVWSVSPHVMQESMEGRAYGLLALFALLLFWRAVAIARGDATGPRALMAVGLVTACGALTHYHFALAAAGVAVYVFLARRGLTLRMLAAMAAGYVVFALAHPDFYHSFTRQQSQSQPFDWALLPGRLERTAAAFGEFAVHPRAGTTVVVAAALALLLGGVWLSARRRGDRVEARERAVLFFLAWTSACVVALYLGFISPVHAMGPKYLSMAWPLFAFLPVLWIRRAPGRTRVALLALLCAWQLFYAAGDAVTARMTARRKTSQRAILSDARDVVVDTVARGVLPRILFDLDHSQRIFAAMQTDLLADPDAWDPPTGSIYVSHEGYGNSAEQAQALRELVAGRHDVVEVPGGPQGIRYYRVEK